MIAINDTRVAALRAHVRKSMTPILEACWCDLKDIPPEQRAENMRVGIRRLHTRWMLRTADQVDAEFALVMPLVVDGVVEEFLAGKVETP